MQETPDPSNTPPRLNCLEGQPAPQVVMEGWQLISRFSPETRKAFWHLLNPMLLTPVNRINQELSTLFCREHDITLEKLLAAVGCLEILLKQASAMNLALEYFREDLAALSDEAGDLIDFVLQHYPKVKQELRRKILMETLAAHGKVMTDLEWRIDKIQHSSRGRQLNTDIVLLTLYFNEGQTKDRITLQLTPEAARKLRAFGDRIGH